jgi:NAD(P)-dependent dehydrogenase (short-subunit alcohol dehydrogenase family)
MAAAGVDPQVALVSGATSGFGQAIAAALHERGWIVYGTTRSAPPAATANGPRAVRMDVDSDAAVTAGVAQVLGEAGRIDVLVNNAGCGYSGSIEDTSLEEAHAQFETNFFGAHRLCRAVLPAMRARGGGRIVNVSSLGGIVSVPFQGFYCASKFALEAYSEALRMELRPFGIHVSMIEPGDFATGITAKRHMAAASGDGSAYRARCSTAVARMARDESSNRDLTPVVRTVLRALAARRPRLHYPVASFGQRFLVALRQLLPQSAFESLVMDYYKIR